MKPAKTRYLASPSFSGAKGRTVAGTMLDLYAGPASIEQRRPLNGAAGLRADFTRIASDMYRAIGVLNEEAKAKKAI